MYKAILEMEINGKKVRLPIFRSKKTVCFASIRQAIRALEAKRIAGRGYVIPRGISLDNATRILRANSDASEWRQITTIAL